MLDRLKGFKEKQRLRLTFGALSLEQLGSVLSVVVPKRVKRLEHASRVKPCTVQPLLRGIIRHLESKNSVKVFKLETPPR